MEKVTLNGIEQVEEQERQMIQYLLDAHSKDLHYLAFADKIDGYSPVGSWLERDRELKKQLAERALTLIEKKEVGTLYPKERLTLYPIEKDDSPKGHHMYLSDNDKNFDLILYYNDDIYKSKYLVVDFVDLTVIKQQDFDLIVASLQNLLKKSSRLKGIYIIEHGFQLV